MDKISLYDNSKHENHATNELPSDNPVDNVIEKAAKIYRDFRESCGYKDPVALDEIEEAYYAGANWMKEQIMKDAITAEIGYYNQHGLSLYPENSLERLGFDEHDNVKIVIIREE